MPETHEPDRSGYSQSDETTWDTAFNEPADYAWYGFSLLDTEFDSVIIRIDAAAINTDTPSFAQRIH
ncbi:MAG TPA: hypothetical protein VFP26_09375 [Gemmatimonadaceae bacterium]|nr:hypothetical protein [Gemmatimonadaceae bacterium]